MFRESPGAPVDAAANSAEALRDDGSTSKLGRMPGDASGDEGSGASGGSRNARFVRSVDMLVLWLSAEADSGGPARYALALGPPAVALLFRLCDGDEYG